MREGVRKHDDVLSVKKYLKQVAEGSLIDYDGHGNPSDGKTKDVSVCIRPSMAGSDIPQWASHIVWYNK